MNRQELELKDEPVTLIVTISDTGDDPYILTVKDKNGEIYYYREIIGGEASINLPLHPDKIIIQVSKGLIASVLVAPLKFPKIPYIDQPETSRPYPFDQLIIQRNHSISSPARMFTNFPVIEVNPEMMKGYWVPVREFIMWHEIGHRYFDTERKADTWATITFLNRGWNLSTAIYALTRILGESAENVKRMLFQNELLKELSKRYYG